MATDWLSLKSYIGSEDVNEDTYIQECWNEAVLMIDLALIKAFRPVPVAIKDRMYKEVGSELYNRKNAPSGGSQFATFDGGTQPVRGPRDPMSQVRPMIRQYVCPIGPPAVVVI